MYLACSGLSIRVLCILHAEVLRKHFLSYAAEKNPVSSMSSRERLLQRCTLLFAVISFKDIANKRHE